MIKRTTIIEIITVLNIILFLYTGIAKIMDYSVFKEQLAVSPILSWAATPVAVLLPVVEFLIVLMLVVPRWRLKGLYASFILMIAFTAYIIAMFMVAPQMPCSCGGAIESLSWQQHLIFNAAYMLSTLCATILIKKEKKEYSKWLIEIDKYRVSNG